MATQRILFVCLGNICRSPMAEGLFLHILKQKGLEHNYDVDSAGTAGFHIGSRPDERMLATAKRKGVELPSKARKFTSEDFKNFDYIIGMDESNIRNIEALKPSNKSRAKLFKMRDFDSIETHGDVPDPYYGGQGGFDNVYDMLQRCNLAFIDYLEKNK